MKQVTQRPGVMSYTDTQGRLTVWSLYATDSQADTIRKEKGVSEITPDNVDAVGY